MNKEKGIYLVARYFMKPRDHVNTSVKGWMDNPDNIRYDESMLISRGLKTKDHTNASVILDLGKKTVVKNSFRSEKEFDEIFMYFLTNYSQYLVPVMVQLDPGYIDNIASEIKKHLPEPATQDNQIIDVEHEEVEVK